MIKAIKQLLNPPATGRVLARGVAVLLLAVFAVNPAFAESVCAVVKIEIKQELTLERQAFEAVMRISNGLDTLAIENVNINVVFADADGNPVLATSDPNNLEARFFIRLDELSGIADVSGNGTVAPSSTAEIRWLIIPAPGSASGVPSGTLYYVGANLSYTLGGELQQTTVTPDHIFVKPLPRLTLDYFLTQDIVADDPFTDVIEPAEPFYLGVRIKNDGAAIAQNVAIDSAQPRIVENQQGLPINFVITGSTVDEQPAGPSLMINFGDILPNTATVGRWELLTNLAGQFTEFSAEFSHADELGGQLTSIIDSVNTHFLEHSVLVDLPGRDGKRDFLAKAGEGYRVYESDNLDTDVNDRSSQASFSRVGQNGKETLYSLSLPPTAGLLYVRLPDSYKGNKIIKSVTRADGKRLSEHNAWNSQKRDRNNNVWIHYFNIFDTNSASGQYTVVLEDAASLPQPPVLQFIPDRTVVEGQQIGFVVEASDPNGDIPSITASGLPEGASFVDNGDGSAFFNWQTVYEQNGSYAITYTATDNTGLSASQTAIIRVNPYWDTDGDGMADDWEIQYFGDLSRDGTGDYDNDGYTDLQEYLNGTDPTLPPPAIPDSLIGEPGNGQISVSWNEVSDASGYMLYWSTQPGVSKTSGSAVALDGSPYLHAELANKTAYYYVVTAVGPGGESMISDEIGVIAGLRDWQAPALLDLPGATNLGATQPHVAARADGQATAVWQQAEQSGSAIWAGRYVPDSGWSEAVKVSSGTDITAHNARVAMDSQGHALAIWQQDSATGSSIHASHYNVEAGWSTPRRLSDEAHSHAGQPVISLLGDGRGMALWQQDGNSVWASLYLPASGWGNAVRIDTDDAQAVADLHVSLDVFGHALAVWRSTEDSTQFSLKSSRYLAGSGWLAPHTLREGISGGASDPQVRISMSSGALGATLVLWNEFDGTHNRILSSQFSSGSGWSAPQAISSENAEARLPRVSLDGAGNALAVWQQRDGDHTRIWSNRYNSEGWGTAVAIDAETLDADGSGVPQADAQQPRVVLSAQGHAVVTWLQSVGPQVRLWAAVYQPRQGWQAPRIIEANIGGDVSHSRIAADNTGDVFVVWQQHDGELNHVAFNRYAIGNSGMSNLAPIVITPGDQSVDEQTLVMLDASASLDPDGSIVSYLWTQLAGPPVTLDAADSAIASFMAPTLVDAVELRFSVVVTDEQGASSEAQVVITVNPVNIAPFAHAGEAQSVDEQSLVTLSGSGTDNDGWIVGYAWTQLSGPSVELLDADQPVASFIAPTVLVQDSPQVLVFRLTVADNEQASGHADVAITVNAVNALPLVSAGDDQSVNEQSLVTLTGTATDSDGSIVSYLWTQLSGPSVVLSDADSATAQFTAPLVLVPQGPQTLVFRLTATDNEAGSAAAEVTITVNPVNALPTADAGGSRAVYEQTLVTLEGSAQDSDGHIVSYQWIQIAGPAVILNQADSATPSFIAPIVLMQDSPTVLSFRLTVTDNEGGTGSDEAHIGIMAVNAAPTVNAGEAQNVAEQTIVTLTAIAEDSDGTIDSYAWQQLSGPAVILNEADSASASFTAPVVLMQDGPQRLSFAVTVTDNEGATAVAEVSVIVEPVNAVPSVSAGDHQLVDEQTHVVLQGSATDSDGSIVSYQWSQLSGVSVSLYDADTATASFTAPQLKSVEVLTLRLTVIDNEDAMAYADTTVTVNPVNTPPIADAGADQIVDAMQNVLLDGSASRDPDADGYIVSYQWQQISGPAVELSNADSAMAGFIAPVHYEDVILVFRLSVSDDEGGAGEAETSVTVLSPMPGQPHIVSPDLVEVTDLQPLLVLDNPDHPVGLPVSYQYEVYRDAAMTELAASISGADLSWQVNVPLDDNSWYYWRARAAGMVLFSEWTSSRFFVNTENDAPGPFHIVHPQDGVWVDSFTPTLSVTNSIDVDEDDLSYRFEVYAGYDLNQPPVAVGADILPGEEGITSWTVDVYLRENHWYTWRAIVTDEHGASTVSDSAQIFVNTVNDAPSVPGIVEPADGSEIISLNPYLVVSNAIDPEGEPIKYLFELDTVNSFDSPGKQISGEISEGFAVTRWLPNTLQDNTWYYWRAKASDGRAQSDWANSRFFVNLFNDPPGAPVPFNPGELSSIATLQPTLQTHPAVDIDGDTLRYEYEVYRANPQGKMLQRIAHGVSDETYWQVPEPFARDGYYYWRVRAIDEHDLAGLWSDWILFYAYDGAGRPVPPGVGINVPPQIELKPLKYKHGNAQALRRFQQGKAADKFTRHVEIRWRDYDPDSNAMISLYYDSASEGMNGVLIAGDIPEDPDGKGDRYVWDTQGVPPGIYYVYAIIDDGHSSAVSYSENAIVVGDGAGRPFIQLGIPALDNEGKRNQRALLQWRTLNTTSNTRISLYYDSDNHGYNGSLIVGGLKADARHKPERYHWDVSALPQGDYYIYAVIRDGERQYRSYAPAPLTLQHGAADPAKPDTGKPDNPGAANPPANPGKGKGKGKP